MSRANVRELLTAAVDGELSVPERKAVQRLLRESEGARALFAQLKADAARIRKLPPVPAPPDLAGSVMAVIRERALTPTPLPPARPARPFNWAAVPVWANFATAAAVLLLISAGSYLYFAASDDYHRRQVAQAHKAELPRLPEASQQPRAQDPVRAPDSRPVTPDPEQVVQGPADHGPELGPRPRQVTGRDTLLGPLPEELPEIERFDLDKIRVSQLFSLHELAADESARKKLTAEMKKDELIRLDLFCQATPQALDQLLTALKGRGVSAVTDGFVQDRLKRKAPTEVMLFTEALTPDEVVQLAVGLGAADKKGGEFSALVAAPFLQADLDKLGSLLGLPPVRPKPAGNFKVDIRKPLPEGTASQVAETLSGMGGSRPAPAKPARVAVVVAYSPANLHPTASKEIKQFLERRGDRRPDAKPLMLVLRTVQ